MPVGPADGGLVDAALVDQQLGGAERQRVARGQLRPGSTIAAGLAGDAGASAAAAGALVDAAPLILGRPDRVAAQVAGLQATVEARLDGVQAPDGGLADALVDAQLGDRERGGNDVPLVGGAPAAAAGSCRAAWRPGRHPAPSRRKTLLMPASVPATRLVARGVKGHVAAVGRGRGTAGGGRWRPPPQGPAPGSPRSVVPGQHVAGKDVGDASLSSAEVVGQGVEGDEALSHEGGGGSASRRRRRRPRAVCAADERGEVSSRSRT